MSDSKLTEVTVAHRTFWYTDQGGLQRTALKGARIEVNDEDLERGEKYDAFAKPESRAEPASAAPLADPGGGDDEPASDKVDDIKAWVDGDPAKAQEALTKELEKPEDERRSTLVEALEKLVGGAA